MTYEKDLDLHLWRNKTCAPEVNDDYIWYIYYKHTYIYIYSTTKFHYPTILLV